MPQTLFIWATLVIRGVFAFIVFPISILTIFVSLIWTLVTLVLSHGKRRKTKGYYSVLFARSYVNQLLSVVCCAAALFACLASGLQALNVIIGGLPVVTDALFSMCLVFNMLSFAILGLMLAINSGTLISISRCVKSCCSAFPFPEWSEVSFIRAFSGKELLLMCVSAVLFGMLPILMNVGQLEQWIGVNNNIPLWMFIVAYFVFYLTFAGSMTMFGVFAVCDSIEAKRAVNNADVAIIHTNDCKALSRHIYTCGPFLAVLTLIPVAFITIDALLEGTQVFIEGWDSSIVSQGVWTPTIATICVHVLCTGVLLGKFPMAPKDIDQQQPLVRPGLDREDAPDMPLVQPRII